jgi:hypothetical protein
MWIVHKSSMYFYFIYTSSTILYPGIMNVILQSEAIVRKHVSGYQAIRIPVGISRK